MIKIDEIEQAAALAEAETGARNGNAKIRLCLASAKHGNHRSWTDEEDSYIRENHGRISEEAIATHLGRSPYAVHLHIVRELHLIAPSKKPEILTGEQVAWGLGMGCGKSVHRLMDEGLMPCRRLPDHDVTRVVDRQALLFWMLEPMHWIYFTPERVGSLRAQGKRGVADCYDFKFWEEAREIVIKARRAWKDEWLTPGQVAAAIGYKNRKTGTHSINTAINAGNLPAVKWGNWRILRSNIPAPDMTINAYGKIVPKVKPKYVCPRGMAKHVNLSTCMKLKFCRKAKRPTDARTTWEADKPWFKYWRWAKRRCTDPDHKSYAHYAAQGILFRITPKQVARLWLRDNAAALARPSLDRKNPRLNYTIRNCRFIEFTENSGLSRRGK